MTADAAKDVLTGGAAAVYGADAVAGVVNFIMNDKFQGVQGEINYNFYNHDQGNPKGVADVVRGRSATSQRDNLLVFTSKFTHLLHQQPSQSVPSTRY